MKKSVITFIAITLGTSAIAAQDATREKNLQTIDAFLLKPEISSALEKEHGKDVQNLREKVRGLYDWQVESLANKSDILLAQADTKNTKVESESARDISSDWLDLGNKFFLLTAGCVALMILLLL